MLYCKHCTVRSPQSEGAWAQGSDPANPKGQQKYYLGF